MYLVLTTKISDSADRAAADTDDCSKLFENRRFKHHVCLVLTTKSSESKDRAALNTENYSEHLGNRRVHGWVEQAKHLEMLEFSSDNSIASYRAGSSVVVCEIRRA